MDSQNETLIGLLKENNSYLKELLSIKKKEHRDAVMAQAFHIFVTLLPFIALLILGYIAWSTLNHYLEIMNNNVNALKSNYDALTQFLKNLIPDFSKVIPDIKFWN